jgi:hypothetical protein
MKIELGVCFAWWLLLAGTTSHGLYVLASHIC